MHDAWCMVHIIIFQQVPSLCVYIPHHSEVYNSIHNDKFLTAPACIFNGIGESNMEPFPPPPSPLPPPPSTLFTIPFTIILVVNRLEFL